MEIISRGAAIAAGEKYFFTGRPCVHGHLALRFTSCRTCTECAKEKSKKWYSDKPRGAAKTRRWRQRQKDISLGIEAPKPTRVFVPLEPIQEQPKEPHVYACSWYAKNREMVLARGSEMMRRKRRENPEYFQKYHREYYAKNRERIASHVRNRRAKKISNGVHSVKDIREIFHLQNGKCTYCKTGLKGKYDVDHIIPLYLGGSNERSNLQILCITCNRSKGVKHPIDFARSRGMLL